MLRLSPLILSPLSHTVRAHEQASPELSTSQTLVGRLLPQVHFLILNLLVPFYSTPLGVSPKPLLHLCGALIPPPILLRHLNVSPQSIIFHIRNLPRLLQVQGQVHDS